MSLDLPARSKLTAGGGAVHLPGDPEFDRARAPWNVAVDQRPAAVAEPKTVDELVEVVRCARSAGLRLAAQATGHNAAPLAEQDLSDVLIVRTRALDEMTIDPERQIARVGGGAIWAPVIEAASTLGLATLHGSSPDVGVVGYSLGGGLGWYARKLGLQANSVTAVELATADGTLLRADATEHPELFWALRGCGGNFGIVTALEFRLHPVPSAFAGMLIWPLSSAERVLTAWADWTTTASDTVTTSFRILNLPPLPELPEPLRGRSVVVIDGAVVADDEAAQQILAPLRSLSPEIDTFGRVPVASLAELHMDPTGPTPAVSDADSLGPITAAAIDAYLGQVGPGTTTTLLLAEFRQLGGAVRLGHETGGVLDRIEADYLVQGIAIAPTPELAEAGLRDAESLTAALRPFSTGWVYPGFAERRVSPESVFRADVLARLATVRAEYDPDRAMVANHVFG